MPPTTNDNGDDPSPSMWRIVVPAAAGLLAVSVVYGALVRRVFGAWSAAAPFGDAYGALGAVFSGLALAGVIAAIRLQSDELRLQRRELTETKAELAKTAEAQYAAQVALRRQVNVLAETLEINALAALLNARIDMATRGISDADRAEIQDARERLEQAVSQFEVRKKHGLLHIDY